MCVRKVSLVWMFLLVAFVSCAKKPADPLDDLLGRLAQGAASFRNFQMSFTEEKSLPDLKAPVRISGILWGKATPDGLWLRLEAQTPAPSSVLLTPSEVRIYSPVERQFERSGLAAAPEFAGLLKGFFLLYGIARADLEREFEVEVRRQPAAPDGEERIEAQVRPRGDRWRGIDGPVRFVWTGRRTLLSEIGFATSRGERFRWTFTDHRNRRHPEEERFVLEPPEGTEVVDLTRIEE